MFPTRFLALLLTVAAASAAEPLAPEFFRPPPPLAGQLSAQRSPLFFDDSATRVTTPADWARRRAEILRRWHSIMGEWPPLLAHPENELLSSTPRDGYTERHVRVQLSADVRGEGYILVPDGPGPFPAILVPFYDPETSIGRGKPMRDFALQLTRLGFVTLSIGSPGGDARHPVLGAATCQPLSFLGYIAANCAQLLADLPEVDAKRLGIVGHSYGGKWAMFGSCLCERYACAVWSDPGIVFDDTRTNINYWDPWYLGAERSGPPRPVGLPDAAHPLTGAYRTLREAGLDLTDLHALMAPRPFLVSGGAEDRLERWPVLNHAIAVNRLLGFENRVALTTRPAHDPTPESNEQMCRFFEMFLK